MRIQDVIVENKEVLDEFSNMDRGIRKELEEKGYKYLKAGVDQEAYLEPGGQTVLKIFGTKGNKKHLSQDQQMFVKWAEFCQRNSDNPFLPKYSGWTSFEYKGKLYLQIRTELLKSPRTSQQKMLVYAISKLGYALEEGKANFFNLAKQYPDEYQRVSQAVGEDHIPLLLNTLLELIHKTQQKTQIRWDLHPGNIMMRPNGQTVFNDPYVLGGW